MQFIAKSPCSLTCGINLADRYHGLVNLTLKIQPHFSQTFNKSLLVTSHKATNGGIKRRFKALKCCPFKGGSSGANVAWSRTRSYRCLCLCQHPHPGSVSCPQYFKYCQPLWFFFQKEAGTHCGGGDMRCPFSTESNDRQVVVHYSFCLEFHSRPLCVCQPARLKSAAGDQSHVFRRAFGKKKTHRSN